MTPAGKNCPHCGSPLFRSDGQLMCVNDYCSLNASDRARRDAAESLGTGLGLLLNAGCAALLVAALVGAFYGLWLLIH